ncbi:MAG: preprotein translocase subunit SecG [Ferruginibacter sp.]
MLIFFAVIIIISSVILGFIVLVQNPKGGGLSGSLGGFSNQLMGVKQTTDVLEKGTWIFAAIVGLLCLLSPAFIPKNKSGVSNDEFINNINTKTQPAAPAPTAPAGTTVPMPQK